MNSNNDILLTIITINRNNVLGLRKTIESVINQTSDKFEYIVIDGGSNDGSVEVIKQFDERIKYWVSEKDNGIYQAMNKGIRAARGKYCQFLNSGDWLLEYDVTSRMLDDLPNTSIIYGNKIREYNGVSVVEKSYAGRRITLLDLYTSTIFHATAYIKRSLFSKYGLYDENLKIVSDWKFYLITVGLNNESISYKDIDLVWFDCNGISTTNKQLDKIERDLVMQSVIPPSIRFDYETFATTGQIIERLKKIKIFWLIILNLYRILIRIDKIKSN